MVREHSSIGWLRPSTKDEKVLTVRPEDIFVVSFCKEECHV
jgi:hypothetical protein